jgi:hypothetical protein
VRFITLVLALLVGLSGFQLAEAKTRSQKTAHSHQRKAKKYKPGKYKVAKQKKHKAKWGVKAKKRNI